MTLSARNAPAVQLLAAPPKVEPCLEEGDFIWQILRGLARSPCRNWSDNMAPEDRRSINNYLMQLRDQMIHDAEPGRDELHTTPWDKLTAMGLEVE